MGMKDGHACMKNKWVAKEVGLQGIERNGLVGWMECGDVGMWGCGAWWWNGMHESWKGGMSGLKIKNGVKWRWSCAYGGLEG